MNVIDALPIRSIIIILISTIIVACTTSPTGRRQLMLISPNAAIVESKKAYASTMQKLSSEEKLVTDKKRLNRIQGITGRVVAQAVELYPKTADWQWSVAVIDAPDTLNAWCMAGGRMAIYTGIIDKLDLNDDEIAQIMGHEIAHALANHTAERMSRALVTNVGLTAAAIFTENNNLALGTTAMAAKLALELPNSRRAETEADEIGLLLAYRAGYQPQAAISLWQKMASASRSRTPQFLSTHPSPGNRVEKLTQLSQQIAQERRPGNSMAQHRVTMMR